MGEGFEIYRVRGDEIILAERVRENLIMDSGVRVLVRQFLSIRLLMGIRLGQYPNDSPEALFERARKLTQPALERGFVEVDTQVTEASNPANADHLLDTFYEVLVAQDAATVPEALDVIRFCLELARTAESRR